MLVNVQPVILCGGNGTRLWPLSTSKIPKQFLPLGTQGSLLGETLRRLSAIGSKSPNYFFHEPILIMNKVHRLPEDLARYSDNVIYEPYSNDTSVAVARATLECNKRCPDSIMLVLPADHYIGNVDNFSKDILSGIDKVTSQNIVLFGINPTSPETRYGYIISTPHGVKFHEKPERFLAEEFIRARALWNSGIFSGRVDLILKVLERSSYPIIEWASTVKSGKLPPFDITILQRHDEIYAHHCSDWSWSDVGTWDSFMEIPAISSEFTEGRGVSIEDSQEVKVLNRGGGNVVVIGCKKLLVVVQGKNILVMSTEEDHNNHLKEVANNIKE